MRTAELTLPGFRHDVCSTVQWGAVGSPVFLDLPLAEHGLELVIPPTPLAHPLDDGTAATLEHSVDETADGMGEDAAAYRRLFGPLVAGAEELLDQFLGPLKVPRHPVAVARIGVNGVRSATGLARAKFQGERARALFGGIAAHSIMPLEWKLTAGFGLMLTLIGHVQGWPFVRGGSQGLADALAAHLRSLGGEIETGRTVSSLRELPRTRSVLLDVTPRQVLRIAGDHLPGGYRRRLARYRYGPGTFKVDYALDGPIPWRAEACTRAGTVHVGGPLEEIAASERGNVRGEHAARPFVLLAQQTLFDPTRAPEGKHTVWAYCHVPNGSTVDMTERIDAQIERFAPGFRERVLARSVMSSRDFEAYSANYVGGDINGGIADWRQLFTRPVARLNPYSTPAKGIYICSSSTPPGGGVHGMCGYFAAQAALRAL